MELPDFLQELKQSKAFLCIIFFTFYTMGLFAFYLPNTFIIALNVTIFFVLLFLILIFNKDINRKISPFFIFFLYLLFIFGFLNAKSRYIYFDEFSNIPYLKNIEIKGSIEAIPKYNSKTNTYKFPFKVKSAKIKDKNYNIDNSVILVVLRNYQDKQLKYKNEFLFKGTISTPQTATNPSQFNYRKFLNNKGILKTFYAYDSEYKFLKEPTDADIKNKKNLYEKYNFLCERLTRKMHDVRDKVILKHSKYIKSPKLEVLGGVVFGDDAINPPDEVKDSFINSGLLHLLAASGLNVALILSMWFCLIYFFNIPYKIKILSGIFMVFLYTLMTGFPPSIVRASVMLFIMLIGKLMYRETNGISLIFMAGLVILIFKPEFINDVGFQLSFLVTLGLIICVPLICSLIKNSEINYIKRIDTYPKIIKSFFLIFSPASILCCFLIPFVAQIWAAPLQAYYFNTFSVYSVCANIMVVPFIGVLSMLGFLSTAFCFIPHLSDIILPPVDFVLNIIIGIILNISNFFSNLPNATVKVPSPNIFMIFTFYILVILFFTMVGNLFKSKKIKIFFLIVCLIFICQFIKIDDHSTEVIFFNVGNADNALIKTGNNKYVMIDTGRYIYKSLTSAKTITLEYLYDKNIKEIDTLIVTHYDSDHSGGLIDILDNIKVKRLIMPKTECTSKNSCAIKEYVKKNNISYIEPYTGQKFKIDNILLTNYIPHTSRINSRNDFSCATLVEIDDIKLLFMADIGIIPYYSIEKYLPSNIFILKSAHHGAKYTVDDKMMEKLKPKYSILSTGKNQYGHPDIETVNTLSKYSKVLTTKELGAIKFKIKDKVDIYNFNSELERFIKN